MCFVSIFWVLLYNHPSDKNRWPLSSWWPKKSMGILPSGKHTKSYWKWPSRNSGFTHKKWWLSIAMLVYQRVQQCIQKNWTAASWGWYKAPSTYHWSDDKQTSTRRKSCGKNGFQVMVVVMVKQVLYHLWCLYDFYVFFNHHHDLLKDP